MKLNELGEQYRQWDRREQSDNDIIAHLTSELGEVFECVRSNSKGFYFDAGNKFKPEGLGSELADVIILAAKLAAYNQIDIERMIKLKHDYNKTRLPNKAKGE
jgi:NTP pyrophosphatase (non-canonical NTP hydrolase)